MKVLFITLTLLCNLPTFGQDMQNRTILKLTAPLSKDLYAVGWIIGNARLKAPNNINIFCGIGYKKQNWWFESMILRQWSHVGNNLLLDFRFQKQFANRSTLYIEQSPFLNKHALYNFFIFEHPLWYKFNIGGETENILKAGKNSLGAGPRISRPLGTIGKTKVVMALSYRMRPQEPDELRLYLVFNVPLRLKH